MGREEGEACRAPAWLFLLTCSVTLLHSGGLTTQTSPEVQPAAQMLTLREGIWNGAEIGKTTGVHSTISTSPPPPFFLFPLILIFPVKLQTSERTQHSSCNRSYGRKGARGTFLPPAAVPDVLTAVGTGKKNPMGTALGTA